MLVRPHLFLVSSRRLDLSSELLSSDLSVDTQIDHSHLNSLVSGYRQLYQAKILDQSLTAAKVRILEVFIYFGIARSLLCIVDLLSN